MRTLLFSALAAGLLLTQTPQDSAPVRPGVGAVAPAFRLNDQSGRAVKLTAPKPGEDGAWTVLAFFPKAATPG